MSASTATPLQELPSIGDFNLYLNVLTHKDLRPNEPQVEWDDTGRLAVLGASVLCDAVTSHFFSKRPLVRAEEIKTWREHYTSPNMLNNWLDSYELKEKFRVPENLRDTIFDDLDQMAAFFHTYVAAVYLTKGPSAVQTWIARLIDPDSIPRPLGQNGHLTETQNNFSAPTTSASTSTGSSATSSLIIPVSTVNEVAMRRNVTVNYIASQAGESHQPIWTVRCLMNNVEKGLGIGKTQKIAKEEAARQAWVAMGW